MANDTYANAIDLGEFPVGTTEYSGPQGWYKYTAAVVSGQYVSSLHWTWDGGCRRDLWEGTPDTGTLMEGNMGETTEENAALPGSTYYLHVTRTDSADIHFSVENVVPPRMVMVQRAYEYDYVMTMGLDLDFAPTRLGGTLMQYPVGMSLSDTERPDGATHALLWPLINAEAGFPDPTVTLTVTTTADAGISFFRHVGALHPNNGFEVLSCTIDGTEAATWDLSTVQGEDQEKFPWARVTLPLVGAGQHTIEWRLSPIGAYWSGNTIAGIAFIQVSNCTDDLSARSVAMSTHNFENGRFPPEVSSESWTISTDSPISGTRSLRSPAITEDNGVYDLVISPNSNMATMVEFDYKVSSEPYCDWLYMVGFPGAPAWGAGWTEEDSGHASVIVNGGASLTLRYAKDQMGSAGADAAWIDNLSFAHVLPGDPTFVRVSRREVAADFDLPGPLNSAV